jgi:DNA-binding helix-turn-helix protein|nr:MAG TPA: helix-turn-helix domain protein [Caudoviricetes sp.]
MIKYNSIDEAIDEAGLKQEFIAKKMGISRQRLYDLRKNPTLLNIEQMELLANILNLKFSDIYDIRKKFKK